MLLVEIRGKVNAGGPKLNSSLGPRRPARIVWEPALLILKTGGQHCSRFALICGPDEHPIGAAPTGTPLACAPRIRFVLYLNDCPVAPYAFWGLRRFWSRISAAMLSAGDRLGGMLLAESFGEKWKHDKRIRY